MKILGMKSDSFIPIWMKVYLTRFTTGVDGAAPTGCSTPTERAKTPRFGWSRLVVLAVEVGGQWSLTTRVCPLFARWSGISGIRSTVWLCAIDRFSLTFTSKKIVWVERRFRLLKAFLGFVAFPGLRRFRCFEVVTVFSGFSIF